MYSKVNTDMNFVEREKEVEQFWKEDNTFEKSMEQREGCPTYTFYDGPPTANGKPHIGHVLTRVIKDMIPRYRTMKGYYGTEKSRMGYPRTAGRAGSRETSGTGWKRTDRAVWSGSVHHQM